GVVVREKAAADEGQRKTLIAVTNVVAAGEEIVGVEAVVDLDDRAVNTVGKRSSQSGVCAGTVSVAIGVRVSRLRPGVQGKKFRSDGVDVAGTADIGCGGGKVSGGRYAGWTRLLPVFTHAFVIDEEKCFVFYDGAAQGTAELIVVERLLGFGNLIEVIARVQVRVAKELQGGAVQRIRTALGDNVNDAAGAATVFRFEI